MDINIWGNIRNLIKETNYTEAERKIILLRWQTNILKTLPRTINNPGTTDGELSRVLFCLQEKAQIEGDSVLLDTLKYLIIPGKFSVAELNTFMKTNQISYVFSTSGAYNLEGGQINMTETAEGIASPKYDKIFISHSSDDIDITKAFFELISTIGVSDDKIFCSSIPECGVPLDEDIYQTIRNQLLNEKVYVLFMLSHNYYKSVACLNEMGAAWILQTSYTSILLPGFDFSDIKGGINAGRISIKLDCKDTEVFSRLTELKDKIRLGFGLKQIDERKWNRKVHEFLDIVKL